MKAFCIAKLTAVELFGVMEVAFAQSAQSANNSAELRWYVGLGLGFSQGSVPQQTIDNVNTVFSGALGSTFTIVDRDDRSTGAKAFLGYTLGANFSIEAGYAVLGKPEVDFDFRGALSSLGTASVEYSMTSVFGDVIGRLPVGERWEFFGRVGLNVGRTSVTFSGQPLTLIASNDELDETKSRVKFGGGVEYALNPTFALRAEWERYRMPDPLSNRELDLDLAIASLLYRF